MEDNVTVLYVHGNIKTVSKLNKQLMITTVLFLKKDKYIQPNN